MRIKRIELINFQIHEKKIVDFTNGLNVIVGDNNSGKSSIIRAIYWVYTNKPAGMWMRRFNMQDEEGGRLQTSVRIMFTDDTVIRRVRGDNENCYYFNDEKFEKFGRSGIPDIIQEYLGRTEMPGIKELVPSVAMQDEQPFMVFESGPNKGSMINYLTGVDIADRMKKELSSEIRSARKSKSLAEEQIELLTQQISQFKPVDEHTAKIKRIEDLEVENQILDRNVSMLHRYASSTKESGTVAKGIKTFEEWFAKQETYASTVTLQDAYNGGLKACKSLVKLQGVTKAATQYASVIEASDKLHSENIEMQAKIKTLSDILNNHKKLQESISTVIVQYKQATQEMLQFEGVQCPTCNGNINVKSICSLH